MLEVLVIDKEVEGLFAMASKPMRRDDDSPDEFGSGAPE